MKRENGPSNVSKPSIFRANMNKYCLDGFRCCRWLEIEMEMFASLAFQFHFTRSHSPFHSLSLSLPCALWVLGSLILLLIFCLAFQLIEKKNVEPSHSDRPTNEINWKIERASNLKLFECLKIGNIVRVLCSVARRFANAPVSDHELITIFVFHPNVQQLKTKI